MIITPADLERPTARLDCWFGDAPAYDYQRAAVAAIVEDWFSGTAPLESECDGSMVFTTYAQLQAGTGAGKTRICMAIAHLLRRRNLHFAPPAAAPPPGVRYCGMVPVECLREDRTAPVVVLAPPGGALQKQWKDQLKRFGGTLAVETPTRRAQLPAVVQRILDGAADIVVLRRTMCEDYEVARAAAGGPPARLIITDDMPVNSVGPSKRLLGRAWLIVSATLAPAPGTALFSVPDAWAQACAGLPKPVRTVRRFREDPVEAQLRGATSPEVLELVTLGNIGEACRVMGVGGEVSLDRLIAKVLTTERRRAEDLERSAETLAIALAARHGTTLPPGAEQRLATAQERARGAREAYEARVRGLEECREECPVCGEEEGRLVVAPCAHGLCESCYVQWAGRRETLFQCPQCSARWPHNECTGLVSVDVDADGHFVRLPTRQQLLEAVVDGLPAGARPLVFLGGEGGARTVATQFGYRVGNCPSAVAQFQEGKIAGLVLDAKTRAEGLELQCATHLVIAAEVTNPDVYKQIVGRCQRVGRAAPLQLIEFARTD